ncbi:MULTISPECIES: hypothetical protein [unclassified Paenibacillus]|uniref:coiled-coil domain-containing protein n=1 Tax=unclassified Paenibacillus TaxID=185978 RepID=UPI0009561650|nr:MULTISPECIES: hypothetical protein [unclassified Paenibacillus]ASS65974.1 hypothetical protein CIC07_07330 [Paenibacillus sp. RUD330]SIQ16787.1 hypothetical protein SAMN05880555_0892 [Paenibacillus sp. RU4X]SIQ38746.1 hypothetical protein SAMN05880570_0891 [Paenibacillus sp. RU4T]
MKTRLPGRILLSLLAVLLLGPLAETFPFSGPNGADEVYAQAVPVPSSDDDRQLMEKSLAVLELDRELERIAGRKDALQKQLDASALQLKQQEEQLRGRKQRAGEALSRYYTGRKDMIWNALFQVRNLGDLFRIVDMMDLLMDGDRKAIADYRVKSEELKSSQAELQRQQAALDAAEQSLLQQKARAEELDRQLQEGIGGSSDPEAVKRQIAQLGEIWQNSGRAEVQAYFRLMSKAMNKLPAWLESHPDYVKLESGGYTLRLPDDALNSFLAEQDDSLKGFQFRFGDGKVQAGGSDGAMSVEASGIYEVVDTPKNGIKFRMDELVFNGYKLPKETMDDLLRTFDVGFYPGKFISFLKVTSVQVEEHELVIRFGFSL